MNIRTYRDMMRIHFTNNLPLVCHLCGEMVNPGDAFRVGHIKSVAEYPELATNPFNTGPTHVPCEERDARQVGKRVAKLRQAQREQYAKDDVEFLRKYLKRGRN